VTADAAGWILPIILTLGGGLADLVFLRRPPARLASIRTAIPTLFMLLIFTSNFENLGGRGGGVWGILTMAAFLTTAAAAAATRAARFESHPAFYGICLLGAAGLLGVEVVLVFAFGGAVGGSDQGAFLWWRNLLLGYGVGAWLAATVASTLFAILPPAAARDRAPHELPQRGRAQDPGRQIAPYGQILLTVALVLALAWNLVRFAVPWRSNPSDLWLLASWVLGAAYLHAVSPWRPLGLPRWLPALIAAAAFGAAVLSALSASTLLVG
jgi:hypothetical protein